MVDGRSYDHAEASSNSLSCAVSDLLFVANYRASFAAWFFFEGGELSDFFVD